MKKSRTVLYSLLLTTLVVMAGVVIFYASKNDVAYNQNKEAAEQIIHQDPDLLGVLESIRADKEYSLSDLNLTWGELETEWSVGSYYAATEYSPATIVIKPGHRSEDLPRILAHEYIHHRWNYRDNIDDEQTLASLRDNVWDDIYFQERTSKYDFENEEYGISSRYKESIAYACTEAADWRLSSHLINLCNSIVDRNKLTQFLN